MADVIAAHGLSEELQDALVEKTGNVGMWIGVDDSPDGLDEASDEEDPEAQAKQQVRALVQESADQQHFVAAVQGALECRAVLTDLERASVQLEDLRAFRRA